MQPLAPKLAADLVLADFAILIRHFPRCLLEEKKLFECLSLQPLAPKLVANLVLADFATLMKQSFIDLYSFIVSLFNRN